MIPIKINEKQWHYKLQEAAMKMKSIKVIIIVLSALLLVGAPLVGGEQDRTVANKGEKELESLYKKAKQSIYGKEWLKAMDQFRSIIDTYSKSKHVDESLYWLSYSMKKRSEALENLDEILSLHKQALSHLETIIKKFPGSEWVDDAKRLRVGIAEDLVKKGFKEYKKYIVNGAGEEADMEIKLLALDALLHMDKEKAFPVLEKLIRKHKNPKMRERAIFVISQIQDPRVIPLLVEVAKTDVNRKIRERAIFWLGQVRGPEGRDPVKELVGIYNWLGDGADDLKLKDKIIFSISQRGGDHGVKELIKIYRREKSLKLKKKVIFWLGQMGSKEGEKFIEKILLE
jgi:outer membrane protein assembly factor BamD (BamD/ComL family)